MKNGLKRQALLVVLVSISMLVGLAQSGTKAATSKEAPISISALSPDYALLPLSSRVGKKLFAPRFNKNAASGNMTSAKYVVTSLPIYGYSIPSYHRFFDGASNFNSVCIKAPHRACLLLDIPPPFSSHV